MILLIFYSLPFILGTLSKPRRRRRRRRRRGHGKTKDLIGRTIAQHARFKLCTFLSLSLQNKNMKSPQFASSANRNRDGKLFKFSFGTQRFFCTLCWSWGVAPYETVNTCSHFFKFYLKAEIHFFDRCLLWRCRPDCLSSLLCWRRLIPLRSPLKTVWPPPKILQPSPLPPRDDN